MLPDRVHCYNKNTVQVFTENCEACNKKPQFWLFSVNFP